MPLAEGSAPEEDGFQALAALVQSGPAAGQPSPQPLRAGAEASIGLQVAGIGQKAAMGSALLLQHSQRHGSDSEDLLQMLPTVTAQARVEAGASNVGAALHVVARRSPAPSTQPLPPRQPPIGSSAPDQGNAVQGVATTSLQAPQLQEVAPHPQQLGRLVLDRLMSEVRHAGMWCLKTGTMLKLEPAQHAQHAPLRSNTTCECRGGGAPGLGSAAVSSAGCTAAASTGGVTTRVPAVKVHSAQLSGSHSPCSVLVVVKVLHFTQVSSELNATPGLTYILVVS
jgi:hypothetical protein